MNNIETEAGSLLADLQILLAEIDRAAFILPAHMKRNLARTLAVISGFAAALI